MVRADSEKKTTPQPASGGDAPSAEPVAYSFDNRAFIVQPVFKNKPAGTISAVLLRLMRADIEQS